MRELGAPLCVCRRGEGGLLTSHTLIEGPSGRPSLAACVGRELDGETVSELAHGICTTGARQRRSHIDGSGCGRTKRKSKATYYLQMFIIYN